MAIIDLEIDDLEIDLEVLLTPGAVGFPPPKKKEDEETDDGEVDSRRSS